MILALNDSVIPSADVVVTELEGEAVLLDMETKLYFTLNSTGAFIWKAISKGLTLEQVAEQLTQEYDVCHDYAKQCVLDLVSTLLKERLVKSSSD